MVDAARRASADRITAVIPFLAMRRQDRKDQAARPDHRQTGRQSALRRRRESGADDGSARAAGAGFFDIPVDHLYSLPVLIHVSARELKRRKPWSFRRMSAG